MSEPVEALTEREKQALRLLLDGHDAKSLAASLGLSVHTVNERLRDARRKLGVSSSREAARRLAAIERPDSLGDKHFGVAAIDRGGEANNRPDRGRGSSLAWLGGGMLIMSLIVAAGAVASLLLEHGEPQPAGGSTPPATVSTAAVSSAVTAARQWLSRVDDGRWAQSWEDAAPHFRSRVARERWIAMIAPVRQPLGAALSRIQQSATSATSLPGAPDGDYVVIQFRTRFAHKDDAVETVTVVRDAATWKAVGYFIR